MNKQAMVHLELVAPSAATNTRGGHRDRLNTGGGASRDRLNTGGGGSTAGTGGGHRGELNTSGGGSTAGTGGGHRSKLNTGGGSQESWRFGPKPGPKRFNATGGRTGGGPTDFNTGRGLHRSASLPSGGLGARSWTVQYSQPG